MVRRQPKTVVGVPRDIGGGGVVPPPEPMDIDRGDRGSMAHSNSDDDDDDDDDDGRIGGMGRGNLPLPMPPFRPPMGFGRRQQRFNPFGGVNDTFGGAGHRLGGKEGNLATGGQ